MILGANRQLHFYLIQLVCKEHWRLVKPFTWGSINQRVRCVFSCYCSVWNLLLRSLSRLRLVSVLITLLLVSCRFQNLLSLVSISSFADEIFLKSKLLLLYSLRVSVWSVSSPSPYGWAAPSGGHTRMWVGHPVFKVKNVLPWTINTVSVNAEGF